MKSISDSNDWEARPPNIVSVTVSFNPDPFKLLAQLTVLQHQVQRSIVVDNASMNRQMIRQSLPDHVTLIELNKNYGIAAAQNIGIQNALVMGATHILLLDDDSLPCSVMVSQLLDVYLSETRKGKKVAAVGPSYIDERTGHAGKVLYKLKEGAEARSSVEVRMLISSGKLISAEAFREIGRMNEYYFIDHVDTEWCLRAEARGFSLYLARNAMLKHNLGDARHRLWLGRWRHVPIHQPLRNYYMVRNSILIGRDGRLNVGMRMRVLLRAFLLGLYMGSFVTPRQKRISNMLIGIRDACKIRIDEFGKK